MSELTMPPNTSAAFTVAVKTDAGLVITGATVRGVFRRPNETVVATGALDEASDGQYTLLLQAAWTMRQGVPAEGTYFLDVTIQKDQEVLVERYPVRVRFS